MAVSNTASAQPIDLVIHNAVVHTVDPSDRVVQAIAIAGGRIAAIGTSDDMLRLAGSRTGTVDLGGRTVVPGFVDAHPHLDTVGARLLKPGFGEPSSIDEVLDVLTREVTRCRAGEWIVCNPVANEPDALAYPERLRENRWPDRHDLDRVAPENPVYIEPPPLVAPGAAILNSAALKLTGVTRTSALPDGVQMQTDEDGEPTGVFLDFNFPKKVPIVDGSFQTAASLFPGVPGMTAGDVRRGVQAGVKAFNAAGITAIYEGHGIAAAPQKAYLNLWQSDELTVRTYFVISYPVPLYADLDKGQELIDHTARYAAGKGFGDHLLKYGGLGFSFDSAAAMGACLMREPYVGALGKPWHGVQLPTDEAFRDIVMRCAQAGIRVQVQCSGGAAIDKVLAIYQQVDRRIPIRGKRWTIQHCQFPSADNMRVCGELGVLPTTSANFLWLYGSIYLRSFGERLSLDAIPFKTWMDCGVPIAQSSDGRPFEPMFGFWQMLARRDAITGRTLATPAQQLTRQQALRAYTLHGAMAAFWDQDIGSIEPGKFADLAVLSDDILSVELDRIRETKVLATLLAGKPVHDGGLFS